MISKSEFQALIRQKRQARPYQPVVDQESLSHLPGTKLKQRIAELGISPNGTCGCNAIANEMDAGGWQWCLDNLASIVDRMMAELDRRGWTGTLLTALVASPIDTVRLTCAGLSPRDAIERLVREACSGDA